MHAHCLPIIYLLPALGLVLWPHGPHPLQGPDEWRKNRAMPLYLRLQTSLSGRTRDLAHRGKRRQMSERGGSGRRGRAARVPSGRIRARSSVGTLPLASIRSDVINSKIPPAIRYIILCTFLRKKKRCQLNHDTVLSYHLLQDPSPFQRC